MPAYIACDRCVFSRGDTIDGQYRVDKPLGEGTFGMVYRVIDRKGITLALKLLKLWEVENSEREKLLKRFDMEYETGRIASNYLVHSVGKGNIKGNPYILMDYMSGGDLLQAAEEGRADFPTVGANVLYGLRDLHHNGKVHRDLKPENVLMKGDGTAVLTDFGISGDQNKRLTERGVTGKPKQIFGTYGYMPPEQVNPKRGDATVLPTTDIFSFGVMMYQLLTYVMPFGPLNNENDLVLYLSNGRNGRWDRDRLRRAAGGEQWMRLIEGCLEPDYKKRLQSTDDAIKLLPPPSKGNLQSYKSVKDGNPKVQMEVHNGLLLRVMQGEEYGRVYRLNDCVHGVCHIVTMGRQDPETPNVIPIKEAESSYVSRKHCTLELGDSVGAWYIRDGQWDRHATNGWKSSLNGTYVNSTEVDKGGMQIKPGDIISIGDVKLRVEGY